MAKQAVAGAADPRHEVAPPSSWPSGLGRLAKVVIGHHFSTSAF
jgi:hypothetical protein